jgi:hypothetical protein
MLRQAGYIAMSGQIADASLVAAPRQRNTDGEKKAIKQPDLAIRTMFRIDRRFGFIRRWAATDTAACEGRRLRQALLDKSNTASGVWADTAYRSGPTRRSCPEMRSATSIAKKPNRRAARDDAAGQQPTRICARSQAVPPRDRSSR